LSPSPAPAQITIVPGSAESGAQLFKEKGCAQCHTTEAMVRARTPVTLAAELWNHSPDMWRAQKQRSVRPVLDSKETADLFSYFFSLAYFSAPGNPLKGQRVFEEKTCGSCHDT